MKPIRLVFFVSHDDYLEGLAAKTRLIHGKVRLADEIERFIEDNPRQEVYLVELRKSPKF